MYLDYRHYKFNIIKKSRNKHVYFRKQTDGTIKVTCPFHLQEQDIYQQLDWFINKLEKSKYELNVKVGYDNHSEFRYLGNVYTIKYVLTTKRENAYLKDKFLIVHLKAEEHAPKVIDRFINTEAKRILPKIFIDTLAQFKHIAFTPALKISNMRSRFGVCYYKKQSITLASMLIHYNIECITYVIVHELCHFMQPNHSPKFYNIIALYLPNYKSIQQKLKHT